MQLQLIWKDELSHKIRQPILETPITLGSEFAAMPDFLEDIRVSRIVIYDETVLPYHVLIEEINGQIIVSDQSNSKGIFINNIQLPSSTLFDGDKIRLGNIEIEIKLEINTQITKENDNQCENMLGFLVKRRCLNSKAVGSNYCEQCQSQLNAYEQDYNYYPDYGRYDSWGSHYYHNRSSYYDNDADNVAFTEGDAVAFESEMDQDFEQDMGAS
jgi:hypothetical protein